MWFLGDLQGVDHVQGKCFTSYTVFPAWFSKKIFLNHTRFHTPFQILTHPGRIQQSLCYISSVSVALFSVKLLSLASWFRDDWGTDRWDQHSGVSLARELKKNEGFE